MEVLLKSFCSFRNLGEGYVLLWGLVSRSLRLDIIGKVEALHADWQRVSAGYDGLGTYPGNGGLTLGVIGIGMASLQRV